MTDVAVGVEQLRITVSGSGAPILDGVTLTVRGGEILGLVGESGSGKTSLGMAMLGMVRRGAHLADGAVRIGTRDLLACKRSALRHTRGKVVTYVAQDPATALNPGLRIGKQLLELIEAHEPDVSPGAARQRVHRILDDVSLPGDDAFLARYPHQLSGGQQQRVCIAMAFLLDPRVVVLDEPTTGLDVVTQAKVLDLVRAMCTGRGVAALYVSHDLAVVAQVADRVVVLYAGQIVEEGSRDDVLSRPRHPYTSALLRAAPELANRRLLATIPGSAPPPGHRPDGCPFRPRCELAGPPCADAVPSLQPVDDGHRVRCVKVEQTAQWDQVAPALPDLIPPVARPAMLTASRLKVAYGQREVLADVSLDLVAGECLAVVGESGSGKSTLARTLAGLVTPSAGVMVLDGAPLPAGVRPRSREARRAIQYVFQNPYASLNPRKTVESIVTTPLRLFGLADRGSAHGQATEALEQVGLQPALLQCYPPELSGGERQRIAVARAIACRPQVLICDEVTSALDVSAQAAMVGLLRDLVDRLGLALLFVTHDLPLVRSIAERVAVLHDGRIAELGPVAEVIARPKHPYTQSLVRTSPTLPSR